MFKRRGRVVAWGGGGVIWGGALVRVLGGAASPEEGRAAMEQLARSLRGAIPH